MFPLKLRHLPAYTGNSPLSHQMGILQISFTRNRLHTFLINLVNMAPSAVLISVYANLEHFLVFCELSSRVSIEDVRWAVATTLPGNYTNYEYQQFVDPWWDERRRRCMY